MKTRSLQVMLIVCAVLFAVATLGCGSGLNYGNPTTTMGTTQNPLVAQYQVTIPRRDATAWVEFGADTTYGRQTSSTPPTTAFGQTVNVLVAGMKAKTTYHMRAHVDWYGGGSWVDQDQTFTTGPLSPTLITPGFTVTQPNLKLAPSAGVELLDLVSQNDAHILEALVTDLEGNVIWYYDVGQGNYPSPLKPMTNGHFLIVPSSGFDGFALQEIDLAGNVIRQISPAQVSRGLQAKGYAFSVTQFHHDVTVLPDGDWIVLANTFKEFTDLPGYPGVTNVVGDALIDLDPNWNVVWAWSSFDHLDVNRHLQGLPDWTHSNAIVYSPTDGNLLLSMRNQSWILKIDYANGQGAGDILWKLGYDGDFTLAGGDPSQWFYGQHFPNPISFNGSQVTLAVFDDGNARVLDGNGDLCGNPGNAPCQSRGTIYQIDESTKTAGLQWQDSPGLFTFWGGSIGQLANGNVEFDLSEPFFQDPTASQVMEVTQTANPAVVWQMNIQGANAYRAYRIPSLYPGVTWQQ